MCREGEDSRHDLLEALQRFLGVVVVLMAGVCVLDEIWRRERVIALKKVAKRNLTIICAYNNSM